MRRDPQDGHDLVRAEPDPGRPRARVRRGGGQRPFLAVGTSLVVYPGADLPRVALEAGASLVILNAEETPYDRVAHAVDRHRLEEVLPNIVALV